MNFVSSGVAFEFGDPKFTAVGWGRAVLAAPVAMPEAAMNEDNSFVFGQDDVGTAREVFPVKPKTITHSVEERPDEEFRFRVLPPDAGHVARALRRCEPILQTE